MSERWKSYFKTALFFFIGMTFLELLGDYMLIKESAFEPLKSLKFYVGKILFSLFIAIPFELVVIKFLKKTVKK